MPIADQFPRLRRLSPLLLLLAAIIIYFGFVAPHVTEDHDVTLALQGPTRGVTRIEIVWTGIDVHPGEAVAGTTMSFEPGKAPAKVRTSVHAAPGTYRLDITIHRGTKRETLRRKVELGHGDLKVFVPLSTAPTSG